MKTYLCVFLLLFLIVPAYSGADTFLEVPIISNAKVVSQTDSRLEINVGVSHAEAVSFYKEALKTFPDIKFRDWSDDTYIEDDGKLPWHSITISKRPDKGGTSIVILKDNWTWIIGTLALRFVGVFVVLIVLLTCMSISGAIISRYVGKSGAGNDKA